MYEHTGPSSHTPIFFSLTRFVSHPASTSFSLHIPHCPLSHPINQQQLSNTGNMTYVKGNHALPLQLLPDNQKAHHPSVNLVQWFLF